jgi:hypothetical protein
MAYGEGLYSITATQHTYNALADRARQALSRGDSVILDASFAKRDERQRMAALAQEIQAECYILECWAPEMALRARLRAREHSSMSISDAREEILDQFQRNYEPWQADESTGRVRLDTTETLEECVQQALATIDAQRR